MEKMTNTLLIENMINSNGGYITRRDINMMNIPSVYLSNYVKKHKLVKHATGFYSKKDWLLDDMFVFQYSYPKFIYSFYLAAYLHNLGDYIPPFLEVTGPKNYRPFPLPKKGVIVHTDTKDETYNLGITEIETITGHVVKVYDIERTVCDFIRYSDKIDGESFVKCIHAYKKRKDKDPVKLIRYAKALKIEDKVMYLMGVFLNED